MARRLFADNVELDDPLDRRRAAIAAAVAAAGKLGAIDDEHDVSPAHRTWRVHGSTADLRCEVILNPQHPPRVQSFDVTVETATVEAARND